MIAFAVGERRINRRVDVRTIQILLNRSNGLTRRYPMLEEDGLLGPKTFAAIKWYQAKVVRLPGPDGVVDPGGPTIHALRRRNPVMHPDPRQRILPASRNHYQLGGLSEDHYIQAASRLDCEVAAIKAVVQTEIAVRGAFDDAGRPTILFERHKFYRHTHGKFSASHPDICNATPGGYGRFSEQYQKLERAFKLDAASSLKSCSWGAFQILGENYVQSGHRDVYSFVSAMKSSVIDQLEAFVQFVLHDKNLSSALHQRNWAEFARIYNGPGYAKNRYDQKMQINYQRHVN